MAASDKETRKTAAASMTALTAAVTAAGAAIAADFAPQVYTLLDDATETGEVVEGVRGGVYQWSASGTFDGAELSLDVLDDDGVTWNSIDTLSAAGNANVTIGQGRSVMVSVSTGEDIEPAALFSSLRGLGAVSITA